MLKRPQILVLALVSMVFATLLLAPAQASAATLSEDAEKFLRYRAIRGCLAQKDMEGTDPTRIMKGDWWKTQGETLHRDLGGALITGKNPAISCEDGDGDNFIEDSAGVLGFSNPGSMWCSVQPIANRDNEGSGNDFEKCVSGSGDYDASGSKSDQAAQFTEGIKNYSSIGSTFPFDATGAVKYYIYFETFKKFCDVEREKNYIERTDKALADSKEYVVVNEVVLDNGEPKIVPALYKVNKDNGQDHKVEGVWSLPDGDMYNLDCGELAGKTWDFDEDYGRYIAANPDEAVETGGGTGGAVGANTPVCTAGALGWVICPAINFIATMTDGIYSIVENMLVIDPMTVENGGSLYQTWTRFRDIANVLFVIAFFFVIFSQATSVGLSSYGVKKLLPRIIASAILVNISFFLCQIALDLSNIVGVTIDDMFASLHSDTSVDINVISWETLFAGIIAGGAIWGGAAAVLGAGGVTAAIAMTFPFLVTALFAVVTAIAVLIARQVIIVLLIALAPLAFVAFILPNTQKYFQMWQNTFTTMLVMFPLIAALFAGSQLAANIILSSPTSADGIGLFTYIAAICMLFIPLFGIPYIVKFSGGLLGRVAGVVNNPNKGPFDSLRKKAEGYRDFKRDQAQARNLDPAAGATGAFAAYSRRKANREDKYARAKDRAGRANQRYLSNMYSGENNFDESKVDVSAANGDKVKEGEIRARARQEAHEAQTRAGERFATKQLGGRSAARYTGGGANLQAELNRARAGAIAQENEESRKRSTAIEQLITQREQGLSLDQTLEMYDSAYREAAGAGDHETATAILRRSYSKGGAGRSQFAQMITSHPTVGAEAQKHMEEAIYSIANDKRADVVKGGMTNEGVWSLAGAGGMSYEQITSLDDKAMYNKLATISPEQASHILNDDNLKSQIQTGAAQTMLQMRANNASINPNARMNPDDPDSKTWGSLTENTSPPPPSPGGGTPPPSPSSPSGGGGTPPPAPSGGGPTPTPPSGGPAPFAGGGGTPLPTPSSGGGPAPGPSTPPPIAGLPPNVRTSDELEEYHRQNPSTGGLTDRLARANLVQQLRAYERSQNNDSGSS